MIVQGSVLDGMGTNTNIKLRIEMDLTGEPRKDIVGEMN